MYHLILEPDGEFAILEAPYKGQPYDGPEPRWVVTDADLDMVVSEWFDSYKSLAEISETELRRRIEWTAYRLRVEGEVWSWSYSYEEAVELVGRPKGPEEPPTPFSYSLRSAPETGENYEFGYVKGAGCIYGSPSPSGVYGI